MTRFTLITRSLLRNPGRSVMLALTIGLAFFVYLILASFEEGFHPDSGKAQRLIVTSKSGSATPLPMAYFAQLQQMPQISRITFTARSRATYRRQDNYLGLVATNPASFTNFAGSQYVFPPDAVAAMEGSRDGALVGRSIADQEGWQVGQTISLNAISFETRERTRDFSFTIVGIFDSRQPVDTHFVIVNYEYINLVRTTNKDTVSSFGLVPADGQRLDDIIIAVDDAFANSAYPTRTQTETQFMKEFVSQFADITTIVRLITTVGFATILMIVANTMYFAMRERTWEIGVFKIIGFSNSFIFTSMLAETFLLFGLGLALAYPTAYAAVAALKQPLSLIVPSISLTPAIALSAIAIAAALAAFAGGIPAFGAMRIPPLAAMKE